VKAMNGLDRMFMNIESGRMPMDFTGIFILDPSTSGGGHDFDRVRTELAARLPAVPVFTRRPVSAPFGAGHEHWVVDPEFSLDRHLTHVTASAPHDLQALCDMAVELSNEPLDRSRPLWKMYYVDSLEFQGGSAALLLQMHHAAMDAVGGIEVITRLFDSEPTGSASRATPAVPIGSERVPTRAEMLVRSIPEQAIAPARLLYRALPVLLPLAGGLVNRFGRSARPTTAALQGGSNERPTKPDTPSSKSIEHSLFNRHARSPRQSLAVTTITMAEIIAVKDQFGVTVNDVVLSVVGAAVADYLRGRDELPDPPLRVAAPVNIRDESADAGGNHFTFMMVPIPSQITDPIERLNAVSASTKKSRPVRRVAKDAAKDAVVRTNPSSSSAKPLMQLIDALPSSMWLAVGQLAKSPALSALPPFANYVVSNIPGPRQKMYLAGAQITHLYGRTITAAGIGLFVCCFSYAGNLDFGVTALADLVPDPGVIAEGIQRHFRELLAVAEQA
jgi:diacylglycerol O-acyltransferase / wax synthase